MRNKLNEIVDWLNKNYSQDSENYSIFRGAKPKVIRYNDETAISLWACGAIVCIHSMLYFISEDDGNWFCNNYYNERFIDDDMYVTQYATDHPCFGVQNSFSIGWANSFIKAITDLSVYVE